MYNKRVSEPVINSAVAKQWAKVEEVDAQAHDLWAKLDREKKKLARIAGLGRKKQITVAISEGRGVRITNNFRGVDKAFAPAFARKLDVKEVRLED